VVGHQVEDQQVEVVDHRAEDQQVEAAAADHILDLEEFRVVSLVRELRTRIALDNHNSQHPCLGTHSVPHFLVDRLSQLDQLFLAAPAFLGNPGLMIAAYAHLFWLAPRVDPAAQTVPLIL